LHGSGVPEAAGPSGAMAVALRDRAQ